MEEMRKLFFINARKMQTNVFKKDNNMDLIFKPKKKTSPGFPRMV
jgi:hypothetical protein